MMKKFLALLLALCIACSLLTACGGAPSQNPGNNNPGGNGGSQGQYNTELNKDSKMVLRFHNSGGGVGVKWIEIAAETFAKNNADREFSNGKKGVYIDIDDSMGYEVENLAGSSFDVLVGEGFVPGFASKNLLLNLDSVVKDDTREGGSIEDNLIDGPKQSAVYNGSYYGIPFLEYYNGLSYNYEVFASKGFFITDETVVDPDDEDIVKFDSKFSSEPVYFTYDENRKSVGSDGVKGTEDDGLPVSMEQFLALMEKISKSGSYAPVVLGGKVSNYSTYFAVGLMAALAGKEQMTNLMNGSGLVEVVKREGSGNSVILTDEPLFPGIDYIFKPETEWVELDAATGYKGSDLVARYYANAIFEIMDEEEFWSLDTADTNRDHLGAQLAFLTGKYDGALENAAMLVEASYWMNEARDNKLGSNVKMALGKNLEDVDVRFMSLPTYIYTKDATSAKTSVLANCVKSYLMANKRLELDPVKKELALEFIAFLNTEYQLQEYTVVSGMARSIVYDLPAAGEDGKIKLECSDGKTYTFASYYEHLWNTRKTDGSNVVYAVSGSTSYEKNNGSLDLSLFSPLFKQGQGVGDRPNPYLTVLTFGTVGAFDWGSISEGAWIK